MTIVLKHFCRSAYQDEVYGKNMRLFNSRDKDGKQTGYRCTVCAKED